MVAGGRSCERASDGPRAVDCRVPHRTADSSATPARNAFPSGTGAHAPTRVCAPRAAVGRASSTRADSSGTGAPRAGASCTHAVAPHRRAGAASGTGGAVVSRGCNRGQ